MRHLLDSRDVRHLLDSHEEDTIRSKIKKRRQCENENDEIKESEDRLSDLPDGVLLHILSFLNTKHVVRTCILSTRWRYLWKRIPTLTLHSLIFTTKKKFTIFVSKILTLRDTSTALHALDLDRLGDIEPRLLKKILDYVCSHNTHLRELGISVRGDSCLIMSCVSSCFALTSLRLSVHSRGNFGSNDETLFPKSLNLPALTSLDLTNFAFCGGENGVAEPFGPFNRLNRLVLRSCKLSDAQILSISNDTLFNLAMHHNSCDIAKIEISAKSLCTFTITGDLIHKICGSSLSSMKQVNVDAQDLSVSKNYGLALLNWVQGLANVELLTVTSTTLQILSLVPGLLEVKLPSLCNLKSLEVELLPLRDGSLFLLMKDAMLKKAAAQSRKEVAKLRKAFKARLEPFAIPDGVVDFLRQNSPSAKVNIATQFSNYFNLKQIVESIKGAKIIEYPSRYAVPGSSSAAPASAAESASASAPISAPAPIVVAPPNLHLCCAEKDDKSSDEDKVEMHQPNTNSELLDNGQ